MRDTRKMEGLPKREREREREREGGGGGGEERGAERTLVCMLQLTH